MYKKIRNRDSWNKSLKPQVPPLRYPRFPVETGGVGELHAAFFTESRTHGRWRVPRGRRSGYAPVGMTILLVVSEYSSHSVTELSSRLPRLAVGPEFSWAVGPPKEMKNGSHAATALYGRATLPFVIPSEAEGPAVQRTFRGNVFRPERTRISCHAAPDAPAQRHQVRQEIGGAKWRDLRFDLSFQLML